MEDICLFSFTSQVPNSLIPSKLNNPFTPIVPKIARIAAEELQDFISNNEMKWLHNFGTTKGKTTPIKGKMFGVLVVETKKKEVGYLSTYSGKIIDEPQPEVFVPSLFDISTNNYFITNGMTQLTGIGNQIKVLETKKTKEAFIEMECLKKERKNKSILLQQELFDQYHFLNKKGLLKSLFSIFNEAIGKPPPSGAGECAAPKLLQYAYQNEMKPLALSEFWWGESPKSKERKQGNFYPSCDQKCRPILNYMLDQELI